VRAGLVAAATLLALVAGGCGSSSGGGGSVGTSITVVATTTQMQDLVRNVGGSRVRVVGILKPNVDPHEYEPKPSDAAALGDATLVVESGVGLDAWMAGLIASAGEQAPVWTASSGLAIRSGDAEEPEGDPHWWHDPTNVERAATALGADLGRVDPAGAATYTANAAAYVARVEKMDAANVADLAQVPVADRKLVTNHDAFGYFAAHYRITVVGSVLDSLSTTAQPSAQKIAELVRAIRAQGVKAIFTESSINPKLERQIGAQAGVGVYANLYGDTLGPPGSPGATYLQMERWNVEAIVAGLLGKPAPAS
jgi:ABC-type Zn uptake system ZnuABC Zn-binding protein ZnuA